MSSQDTQLRLLFDFFPEIMLSSYIKTWHQHTCLQLDPARLAGSSCKHMCLCIHVGTPLPDMAPDMTSILKFKILISSLKFNPMLDHVLEFSFHLVKLRI